MIEFADIDLYASFSNMLHFPFLYSYYLEISFYWQENEEKDSKRNTMALAKQPKWYYSLSLSLYLFGFYMLILPWHFLSLTRFLVSQPISCDLFMIKDTKKLINVEELYIFFKSWFKVHSIIFEIDYSKFKSYL